MPRKSTKSAASTLDPEQMSPEELRAYVTKLEAALTATQTQAPKPAPEKPWGLHEKRWVMVPRTPTNDVIMICGKPYIGRCFVTRETWESIQEIHNKAVRSELARMQTRGNLVPPHLLPNDDVSSRQQPVTIANL